MKINLITLHGYNNYGNRLQAYALYKTLSKYKKTTLIDLYTTKEIFKNNLKWLFFKKKYAKEYKIYLFTKHNIKHKNRPQKNSITIVGSDQVWNTRLSQFNAINSAIKEEGNISYAASIGYDTFIGEERKIFIDTLKHYSYISVREKTAEKLLESCTDKKITTVLDPTLLLEKADYQTIENRPINIGSREKYILCYILGNNDQKSAIEKYAKDNGYKIIVFSDKKDSDYGIEEFIYLIHHAQLVCTDSFHACVFSFIFERPFVAFKRSGKANYMYTRLQNLIDTFKLKNREFNGKEITKENLEVDYTEAKKILKKEQKKSLDFLKKALGIKNEK